MVVFALLFVKFTLKKLSFVESVQYIAPPMFAVLLINDESVIFEYTLLYFIFMAPPLLFALFPIKLVFFQVLLFVLSTENAPPLDLAVFPINSVSMKTLYLQQHHEEDQP